MVENFDLSSLVEPLLQWYDGNARILPWREQPRAYYVWVSEIMLQQTRVEAVKPYYERFLNAFPTIKDLAEAEEETLLKMWEGLGYYNRARNLHKAAKQMMDSYDGKVPDCYEELLKLSGIGSYTAGAVASIAYKQAVPAVDGNVLRIFARVRMDEADILDAKVKKRLEEEIKAIMPQERPGDFNQAMMELGAVVCIPNGEPKCEQCPWYAMCQARIQRCTREYPKKKAKKARQIEDRTILIIQDERKVALRKRPAKGLLAGMYEFPSIEGKCTQEQVIRYLKDIGLQAIRIRKLEESKHIFTHKEWHMLGYEIKVDELETSELSKKQTGFLFVEPSLTQEYYPIPSAFEAYTKYLKIKIGNSKYID